MNYEFLRIELSIGSNFEVHFCQKVFDLGNPLLGEIVKPLQKDGVGKVLFVADQGVMSHHPEITAQILQYCEKYNLSSPKEIFILPGGEPAKTQQHVGRLHEEMMRLQIDRHSFVVVIGGGAVLDTAGFAAATFHRGVRLVRIPTTVLAQNDAGIGVKNGINAFDTKNILGCFAPPFAVINDATWLSTLSDRDYRSGFAEAVKVGLIRDGEFYRWLCTNSSKLVERDHNACQYLIMRCAELHLNQIRFGGDPFEKGSSRPLDYGHWSAHKLESLSKYELSHGEAVAIGMALDAMYANKMEMLTDMDVKSIIGLLKDLGFNLWHSAISLKSPQGQSLLLEGLEEFRQHLGGRLCITLLTGLGVAVEVDSITSEIMNNAILQLQRLAE